MDKDDVLKVPRTHEPELTAAGIAHLRLLGSPGQRPLSVAADRGVTNRTSAHNSGYRYHRTCAAVPFVILSRRRKPALSAESNGKSLHPRPSHISKV
jgi:hypothetical protein